MYITSLRELFHAIMPDLVYAHYELSLVNANIKAISNNNPRKQELLAKSVEVGNLLLEEQLFSSNDRLVRVPTKPVLDAMITAAAQLDSPKEVIAHFVQEANKLPALNQLMAQKALDLQTKLSATQELQANLVKSRDELLQYRRQAKQLGVDLLIDTAPIENTLATLDELKSSLHTQMYRTLFRLGIRD